MINMLIYIIKVFLKLFFKLNCYNKKFIKVKNNIVLEKIFVI